MQQTLTGTAQSPGPSAGAEGFGGSALAPAGAFGGYERQVARKVAIRWLTSGEWVKREGKEPSFVRTAVGEDVARCRVLATVVQTYVSEDGQFASVTLDDGTDTIRAKAFKEIQLLKALAVGDRVDVVGKLREYNGEVYILPEAIAKIADPNAELLRRLELLQKGPAAPAGAAEALGGPAVDAARAKVLEALAKGALSYAELIAAVGDEAIAEKAITALLEEGVCYEPTPGKIRKI